MIGRVTKIERISPRDGVREEPAYTAKGYQLADPARGREKHHAKFATYVKTLDEAAELISKGYSLWMVSQGKRASLIAPQSLRIVRGAALSGAQ